MVKKCAIPALLAVALYAFILTSCSRFMTLEPDTPDISELGYDIQEKGLTGKTYYISNEGNDSNSGSKSAPFKTIGHAGKQLKPGDTLLIRGGEYTNNNTHAVADIRAQGTAENWIRIANYPGETPIIRFDSLRGLLFTGVRYIVVEGLQFDGRSYELDAQEAHDHAEAFKGEDFSQNHYFGVAIRVEGAGTIETFPHHIIVRNNHIHDTSGGGVAFARADYILVEKNIIYRTSFYSPWGESAISAWQNANHDDRRDVYRTILKDNICFLNDNKVDFWILDTPSDGNGIILDALGTENFGILKDGYNKPYTGRVLVANNICFYNGGRGVNIYESNDIDVINNTLIENSLRDNSNYEIELGRTANSRIINNIMHVADGQKAMGGYEYKEILSDFNVIHNSSDMHIAQGPKTQFAEAQFLAAPVAGEKIDLSKLNFGLKSHSPGVNFGSGELAFPIDRNGTRRGDQPNVGAIE